MIDASKIKNLLDLGIDVWVPRTKSNTGNEHAKSPADNAEGNAVRAAEIPSRPTRILEPRKTVRQPDRYIVEEDPNESVLAYKPIAIHLNSFQSLTASVLVERGNDAPRSMIHGILNALNGTFVKTVRKVEFDYPPGGLGARLFESENQFTQQLIKALEVFFKVQEPPLRHLLVVGLTDGSIASGVKLEDGRVFAIDAFPSSAQQKKSLWERIKANAVPD